jgi:short subunit dehydrogenase-like uncharacterized protein
MDSGFLIYGANGYTGELIARQAAARGLKAVLAGRNRDAVAALAGQLGLDFRIAALDDPSGLDAALEGLAAVIHCAGPFIRTSRPMLDACLRRRVHYLDITGEIAVFEAAAARDAEAKDAGTMVMPGAGFDVVPSDCLALHLKQRLPAANHLTLALRLGGRPSHGTAATVIENLAADGAVRRDGAIQSVPIGASRRAVDFGRGPKTVIGVPWGDVATAWYSTGIPNIDTMMEFPPLLRAGAQAARWVAPVLGTARVRRFLQSRLPPGGPSEAERQRRTSVLWGEVRDDAGERRVSRLHTLEGYEVTWRAALLIAERVLRGEAPPGFQTPAKAFGPDLALEVEGTTREDLG